MAKITTTHTASSRAGRNEHRRALPALRLVGAVLVCLAPIVAAEQQPDQTVPMPVAALDRRSNVDFQKEVLPILRGSCLACHNRTKAKAKLILETPADLRRGGESGPGVVPGHSGDSLLLKAAAHDPSVDSPMPPPDNKVNAAQLNSQQLGLIRLWIDQGATGEVRQQTPVVWRAMPARVKAVYALAVSPDGQLAACGRANEIILYELPSGRVRAQLSDPSLLAPLPIAHRDIVESLAFSPDGQLLASGSYREVKLWRRAGPVRKGDLPPGVVASSPDGKLLAIGQSDGTIRLWTNGASGGGTQIHAGHQPIGAVVFSRHATRLAATCGDREVRIWDIASKQPLAQIECRCDVTSLAFASGENEIAAGCSDGLVRLWKLADSASDPAVAAGQLSGHTGAVAALAASPTEPAQLLSGGHDGTLRWWSVDQHRQLKRLSHGAAVTQVAIRADGARFASAGGDSAILWNSDGQEIARLSGDRSAVDRANRAQRIASLADSDVAYRAAHLAEQQKLAKTLENRVAREKTALVSAQPAAQNATQQELQAAQITLDRANQAVREAEAKLSAARAFAQSRQEDAASLTNSAHVRQPIRALVFSSDGKMMATADQSGRVCTWGADTGAPQASFDLKTDITSLAFGDSTTLAVGCAEAASGGSVWQSCDRWVLDRVLGSSQSDSPFADRVTTLDFSPDGRLLASGGGEPSRSGEIILWDPLTGQIARRFDDLDSDSVLCLRFSPDGRRLACGSADKLVQVIDLAAGKLEASLEGHSHHVLGVAWNRDGTALASCGADGSLRFWDPRTAQPGKVVGGSEKELTGVCFLGADQVAVSGGDARVRIIRQNGQIVRSMSSGTGFINCVACTPDGKLVLVGRADGAVQVWNADSGRLIATFPSINRN